MKKIIFWSLILSVTSLYAGEQLFQADCNKVPYVDFLSFVDETLNLKKEGIVCWTDDSSKAKVQEPDWPTDCNKVPFDNGIQNSASASEQTELKARNEYLQKARLDFAAFLKDSNCSKRIKDVVQQIIKRNAVLGWSNELAPNTTN